MNEESPAIPAPAEERHASWLELFFDLVAVAGVAQIAHLLHGEPGAADVGLYVLLFLAFWTAWICFTLYGNVAGEGTHTRTVLAAMFGMAVMAAAVPGVHAGEDGQARALALAYIVVRGLASGVWRNRREILVDWPAAQTSVGVIPWVVSLWAHEPARYWLWALGIALDLYVTFTVSARDIIENRRAHDRREEPRSRRRETVLPVSFATPDADHLGERLGLFVIIVLGEGVAQVIEAASDAPWNRRLYGLAAAAFFLLVALWSLSFRHGYAGVPHLTARSLPARAALPLHCFVSGCLAALAAGLGAAAEHLDTLPDSTRWLLCSSLAGYFLLTGVAALRQPADGRRRLLSVVLPCATAPLLIAGFGGGLGTVAVVWLLVAVTLWPTFYEGRRARRPGPDPRPEA
ncbi:low temperature requirement protein A [Streptomyces sp. NPDC059618]|uniref:low temperature requirement protein A n=1 Tax=Streptomyces sp. NPDC059618 TaxID=3346887 RepID=UPI0036A2B595